MARFATTTPLADVWIILAQCLVLQYLQLRVQSEIQWGYSVSNRWSFSSSLHSITFWVRHVCPRDSFRIWSAHRCPDRPGIDPHSRRPALCRHRAMYPWKHPQVNALIDHTQANEPASYEDATNTANHTQEVTQKPKTETVTETETEEENVWT